MGSWRILLIYLSSAIIGSIGSWLFGAGALSVGSSTAIFGLFGAFLAIHMRYWDQLPPPFRQSKNWWISIVILNAALPVLLPVIDYAAHLAGLLSGLAVGLALLRQAPELKPDRYPPLIVKLLTGVLTAITVAGLIFAGIYAVQTHTGDAEQVFAGMLDDAFAKDAAPEMVNQIAWMVATSPEAEKWQLEQARDALNRVVSPENGRIEIRDTLATVEYRLARMSAGETRANHIGRAIAIEMSVLEDAEESATFGTGDSIYASQLARFLHYRRVIAGALIREELLAAPPSISATVKKARVEVEAGDTVPKDTAVWATVLVDEELAGLLKICLPAGKSQRVATDFSGAARLKALDAPEELRFRTALVEPDSACGAGADGDAARFWPMDAEIRQLP
jgi:hypothetical protein